MIREYRAHPHIYTEYTLTYIQSTPSHIYRAHPHIYTEHTLTYIQSTPSHIYQKEDVRQLEGKLNPEGGNFSVL